MQQISAHGRLSGVLRGSWGSGVDPTFLPCCLLWTGVCNTTTVTSSTTGADQNPSRLPSSVALERRGDTTCTVLESFTAGQSAPKRSMHHTPFSFTAAEGPSVSQSPVLSPLQMIPKPLQPLKQHKALDELKTATCHRRNVAASMTKLNRVLSLVRRLYVDDALIQCELTHTKAAQILKKAIENALANAIHQKGLKREHLYVDEAASSKGVYRKKVRIHGRGMSGKEHNRTSHLKVILREDPLFKPEFRTKLMTPLVMRTSWTREEAEQSR